MKKNQKIVVFGGTGNYGRKIVKHLLKSGQDVRVVSRNALKASQILGKEVEIVEGDITDQEVIVRAIKGVDAILISLSAVSRKLIRKMWEIEYDAVLTIIEEAKRTHVSRLVYISVYTVRMDVLQQLGIPEFGVLKRDIENKFKESDLNWTVLGCPPSQEIFFAFISKGKMMVPGGGKRLIPTVSDEDVGEIASQALLRDDLKGKRFKLPGPHTYSFPEVADMVSKELGKTIKHKTIPLFVINFVSIILLPIIPFVRYIYKSLKLLNNFPEDEIKLVPEAHKLLRETFNYEPHTLEQEIKDRIAGSKI